MLVTNNGYLLISSALGTPLGMLCKSTYKHFFSFSNSDLTCLSRPTRDWVRSLQQPHLKNEEMEKWRGGLRGNSTEGVEAKSRELCFWWYLRHLHGSWHLRAQELSMAKQKHQQKVICDGS